MLSNEQEKAAVLHAFAYSAGKEEGLDPCIARGLDRVGRSEENISHADYIRITDKVRRLIQTLNS